MKPFIIFTFIITICFQKLHAQNLVPNPSFEDTVNCNGPWNCCTIDIATPWFNPNTATSDLYTTYPTCGIPIQQASQNPRTGNCLVATFAHVGPSRDYIEVELSDSLIQGYGYCFSMYISRSELCGGAIDRMGAYFSSDSLLGLTPYNFNLIPHIESPGGTLLIDTANWQFLDGIYYAQGGEKFLTIGNFRDSSQTLFAIIDSNNFICPHAYYYIDDISLTLCDSTSSLHELGNDLSLEFSQFNNAAIIKFNFLTHDMKYQIFDIVGKLIDKGSIIANDSPVEIRIDERVSGIYIINIYSSQKHYFKKIKL